MLSDVGRGGLASVLDVQSLFFLFKKIGFARWQDIEIDLLKLDVQGQGGGRILDVDRQEGWGGPENCTIFMDVIRVSSLRTFK